MHAYQEEYNAVSLGYNYLDIYMYKGSTNSGWYGLNKLHQFVLGLVNKTLIHGRSLRPVVSRDTVER